MYLEANIFTELRHVSCLVIRLFGKKYEKAVTFQKKKDFAKKIFSQVVSDISTIP